MKKTGLMVMGLAAVLGIGSAVGVCGGTKKIIKFEDGKRVEIDVENGGAAVGNEARSEAATEAADLSFGGAETDLDLRIRRKRRRKVLWVKKVFWNWESSGAQ